VQESLPNGSAYQNVLFHGDNRWKTMSKEEVIEKKTTSRKERPITTLFSEITTRADAMPTKVRKSGKVPEEIPKTNQSLHCLKKKQNESRST